MHGAVTPGLGWFLRPAENLFLMEDSGTCRYLPAKLAKARCQGKRESVLETQYALQWESLSLSSIFLFL